MLANKIIVSDKIVNYDGVPGVTHCTQCPILPGMSFKYRFTADQSGTFNTGGTPTAHCRGRMAYILLLSRIANIILVK